MKADKNQTKKASAPETHTNRLESVDGPDEVRLLLRSMIQSGHAPASILHILADEMWADAEENGHVEYQTNAANDIAIITHAARHLTGEPEAAQ
jgi:hypothetical protein